MQLSHNTPNISSMPVSMAVEGLINQPETVEVETTTAAESVSATPSESKKTLAQFKKAMKTAALNWFKSGKVVADLILEARLSLSPEEYRTFIKEDCPFDYSAACKFVKMAADHRLTNPVNDDLLPDTWTLRYEIMMMSEQTFRVGVKTGVIHRDCKLADLKELRAKFESRNGADAKKRKPVTSASSSSGGAGMTLPAEPEPSTAVTVIPMPEFVESTQQPREARGRISVIVSREIADQHQDDLDDIRAAIADAVKKFAYIGIVELELAA